MTDNTLYILDSYALIYRSYFAFINRPLINDKKQNISAVFGFFRNFFNILQNCKPSFAAAAFDSRTPTFRHEMYVAYKATRAETPEDLHEQVPVIEDILHALGIPVLRCDGFEADDIIATLSARCKAEKRGCRILSGDKDLMQLVGNGTLMMKNDKAGGWETIDAEGVQKEWGVMPDLMLDMLSLTGDTADNIPGVPGIGPKTAQKLLGEYGSLDGVFANAENLTGSVGDKIRGGKESALFSKKLIELRTDVPLGVSLDDLHIAQLGYKEAAHLLKKCGAFAVAKQYESASAESGANAAHPDAAPAGAAHFSTADAAGFSTVPAQNAAAQTFIEEKDAEEIKQNKGDYRLIRTEEALRALVDSLLDAKTAAFDCETDSLNAHKARLAGFSLCAEKGKAYYVPIETSDMLLAGAMVSKQDALAQLERLFYNADMTLIMHNGKYDLEVLLANNMGKGTFPSCRIYDTMIAAWLLQPDRESFKLEALAERKLGLKGTDFADIVPKGSTFMDVPLETACSYAAED
ncbi:MAG: 5'-3' exonuclease H3TH domain-containing protein, partial [Treponema maltophilum]